MTALTLALASVLPAALAAIEMTRTQGIIAAVVVVLIVLIAWKFLKLAFKIALVIAAAALIFFALRSAGVL